MKQNLYTIRDNIAEVFNKPFTEVNDSSAIRSFSKAIDDNPHKDDYALYSTGFFDTDTGELEHIVPIKIYTGFEVIRPTLSSITEEMQINDLETFKKQSGEK